MRKGERGIMKLGRRIVPKDQKQYVESPPRVHRGAQASISGAAVPRAVQAQGVLLRFPPQFSPPRGALDFQATGNGTVAGPNTTSIVPGVSFTIPRNSVGIIRSLEFDINSVTVLTDVRFSLLFNEAPVPGWSNIGLFPRAASSIAVSYGPEETFIWVPDGQTIQVQVTVTDAASYLIGALFHGWHFSKSIAAEYGLAGQ
jgi:hypothetical protein